MKRQIVLDEQDIKEFQEDAKHLFWLYNRMVLYGEKRKLRLHATLCKDN